ncbi:hypothetical protein ROA7450_03866 [Roseovarius albus]|uniref:Uncharacterized protein n=1 Tax=Roseovarius albus TaxID=1247867 RepID=A0A1X7A7E1_9RHOB|nr:hypothetical protein [Roseovarius albus]SLN70827.1 hypothetical protein ROA7450_03866 [Roseovarius albus]
MHTQAELKEQMFQQALTMVEFIVERGIERELPEPGLMALLDLPEEDRAEIPLADILRLNQALSEVVAPTLPETIQKMEKWKNNKKYWILTRVAPLPSIAILIGLTMFLLLAVGFGLSQHSYRPLPDSYIQAANKVYNDGATVAPNAHPIQNDDVSEFGGSEADASGADTDSVPYFQPVIRYLQGRCRFSDEQLTASDQNLSNENDKVKIDTTLHKMRSECKDLRLPLMLRIYLFFGALGMLGAAYSSIYDSFTYVREGRYDMRLASTYFVRILLGGFSGVLLAEPLSAFLEQGVISSILLAFLGGFSAQLVYDLLTKLVDSVGNMFRADRRKEMQAALAQAEVNARVVGRKEVAAIQGNLAQAFEEAQNEPNPEAKANKMQSAVLQVLSGAGSKTSSKDAKSTAEQLPTKIKDMTLLLDISVKAAEILPSEFKKAGTAARQASDLLNAAHRTFEEADTPTSRASVHTALTKALAANIAPKMITDGIKSLGTVLAGDDLSTVAKTALAVSSSLNAGQMARWRYVAYGAKGADISLLENLDAEDIEAGLSTTSGAELNLAELLSQLRAGEGEAFFADHAGSFTSRDDFGQLIAGWLDVTAREALQSELAGILERPGDGRLSPQALMSALEKVAGDSSARGGLQMFEILGAATSECEDPKAALARLLTMAENFLHQGVV